MHAKFAPRIDQSIHHQQLQHLRPAYGFPLHLLPQLRVPELPQLQLPPQLTPQPAVAEGPRPTQFHRAQFDLDTVARLGRNGSILREQTQRRVLLLTLVEDLQSLAPGRFLAIVDFPQIQHRPLRRLVLPHATVLHHAEVAMLLAIFFPDFGAQKHGPCHHARTFAPGEEGRSAPHALCSLPALPAKQLSEIQNAIFRDSLRYCEREVSTTALQAKSGSIVRCRETCHICVLSIVRSIKYAVLSM